MCVFTLKFIRFDHYFTEILVRKQGHGKMKFGGDAYWQWGIGASVHGDGSQDHIRNHGRNINWSEWLFNSLIGPHASPLMAFGEVSILSWHPDYEAVSRLWDLGEMDEAEVLKLTGGLL